MFLNISLWSGKKCYSVQLTLQGHINLLHSMWLAGFKRPIYLISKYQFQKNYFEQAKLYKFEMALPLTEMVSFSWKQLLTIDTPSIGHTDATIMGFLLSLFLAETISLWYNNVPGNNFNLARLYKFDWALPLKEIVCFSWKDC